MVGKQIMGNKWGSIGELVRHKLVWWVPVVPAGRDHVDGSIHLTHRRGGTVATPASQLQQHGCRGQQRSAPPLWGCAGLGGSVLLAVDPQRRPAFRQSAAAHRLRELGRHVQRLQLENACRCSPAGHFSFGPTSISKTPRVTPNVPPCHPRVQGIS